MKKDSRLKLESIISDLEFFLTRDFSSKFRDLSDKEDRQLFFRARLLTRLKHIAEQVKDDEKVIAFPVPQKVN